MGDKIGRYGIAALCAVVVLGITALMVATESWAGLAVDAVVAATVFTLVYRHAKPAPTS